MRQVALGPHGPKVGPITLGSMAWGAETSEGEVHRLIDVAAGGGVTLLDTAELYPVPFSADTFGLTETIIGSWLRARKAYGRMAVATKVTGHGVGYPWVRGGAARLDQTNLLQAVEGSLARLGVDAIDLLQLHWPARSANYFGTLGFQPDPHEDPVPLEETLATLDSLRRQGKIVSYGVCNETPWGIMAQIALADRHGWARPTAIQNPFNLLNRIFEIGLAEVAYRENFPLLAYSPLAHGTLSGKYLDGQIPPDSRLAKYPFFKRYRGDRATQSVAAYAAIAAEAGMSLVELAIAFVVSRPFVASAVVAASHERQLEQLLAATATALPEWVVKRIEAVHAADPNPCP